MQVILNCLRDLVVHLCLGCSWYLLFVALCICLLFESVLDRWHGVASWTWDAHDDACGICRMAFDGCCPDCKMPGDDCPLSMPFPYLISYS